MNELATHANERAPESFWGWWRHCSEKSERVYPYPVHQSLDVRFGVRIEVFLAALLARSFGFGRCDVPVRPAFPGDGVQVLVEIIQSGPAEGPVDVVDDKTGLENNHVDGVVDWIGVFAMRFVLVA